MLAELYVLTGRDAGRGLNAGPGSIYVGRAATNHLRIRDPLASRVHFRIDVTADRLTLADNESGNGTYLNDERVQAPLPLADGDEIRLGSTRIKVLIETDEDRARWARRGRIPAEDASAIEDSCQDSAIQPLPVTGIIPEPRSLPDDEPEPGAEPGDGEVGAEARPAASARLRPAAGAARKGDEAAARPTARRPRVRNHLREVLPGYRLEAKLGGGSRQGVAVYRAVQTTLDRPVALKVLVARGAASEADVQRLLREARAIARVPHPNIVTIHDVFGRGKLHVIVMEFLAGGSLADRLSDGPLAPAELLEVGLAVSAALAAAHARGLVHRNVKPSNVIYGPEVATYKLVDFGLVLDPQAGSTGDTCILGAPPEALAYAAPEQLGERGRGDPRTDVYSLGATLHACAAGGAPFAGRSVPQLAAAITRDPPPPLPPRVSPGLAAVIARCLEKDPAARYADGAAVRDALRALSDGS